MKQCGLVLVLMAAMFGLARIAQSADVALPAGTAVEAEAQVAADSKIIVDEDASGGKAVTNSRAWQPMFISAVPAEGDEFTVWMRHRGGPFVFKSVNAEKQKELKTLWGVPETWAWSNAGRYTRAELGEKLLIIRGSSEVAPAIDCVVLATDEKAKPIGYTANPPAPVKALPAFEPEANAPAQEVQVKINWETSVGHIGPMLWGVNDYEILNPAHAADPKLQAYLADCQVPIVRIHQGSFPTPWLDATTKTWDVEKIKAGFAASTGYGQARVMMNIATWPKWMEEPGKPTFLAADQIDAYAALVGDLVRVMRDDVKHKIDYWEVTNEKEGAYEKAGRLDELWTIYKKTAEAIRKVDPTAKVGGPAFTWAKATWVNSFVSACAGQFDFITWHNYGTGDIYESNEKLMSQIDVLEGNSRNVTEAMKKLGTDRKIELFLSEYNVKWTWNPFERRHANNVGAVFHACVVRRMALLGVDGAMVWHVKGNAYGLLDDKGESRSTAALYKWGPKYLVGNLAAAEVSDEKALEVLPVLHADGTRALLLSNKSNHTLIISSPTQLVATKGSLYYVRVDASGVSQPAIDAAAPLLLPGYSNTLISQRP